MKNNDTKVPNTSYKYVKGNEFISPVDISETLHLKIEPLIGIQTILIDSATKLSQFYEPTKRSIEQVSVLISPIAESIRSLGSSLAEVSKTALATGELLKVPTYDFLNSPITSALNASVDAIKIGQERIMSIMPDNKRIADLLDIGISSQVSQISALNSIALDSLQSSPVLFPVPRTDEKISNLDEKIQSLESKIIHLENKNNDLSLTDITANIIKILENLDEEIADCFKGAMTTLLDAKGKDMVAQVAESLTRVIERLPFSLSKKSIPLKINKNSIYDAIGGLTGITKDEAEHLVEQQHYFYSTLGLIRHRNKKIFNLYNTDHSRFKALVVQTEAYIYILLTFGNKN